MIAKEENLNVPSFSSSLARSLDLSISASTDDTSKCLLLTISNILSPSLCENSLLKLSRSHLEKMQRNQAHRTPISWFTKTSLWIYGILISIMIWCDMIWYMIWYDMIWYDMIWYDKLWYDMIWYDMIDMIWYDMIDMIWFIWYDMIWYDWYDMIHMIWYDMIWYDMIWYDMIWYDKLWYDMIWYDIWYDVIYDMIYDMIWWQITWYIYINVCSIDNQQLSKKVEKINLRQSNSNFK